MNGPVYIHEQIAIEGGARGRLIELVCSRLAPHFERHHGVRLVGAWATVGSTGDWPEVRLHWEMDDWAHFARAQAGLVMASGGPVERIAGDDQVRGIAPGPLVVEVDGHEFHERTKLQAARDRQRDRAMIAEGFRVVRFTGQEVYRAAECADEVGRLVG